MPDKRGKPLICFWDLECTDLKADWGYLLCAGFKYLGKPKVYVPSLIDFANKPSDPTDDRALTKEICRELARADIWVTWYGRRFDLRFLMARCAEHHLPPPPVRPHIDLWETARARWSLTSNRLNNVQSHLGTPEEKTPIHKQVWRKARAGHRPSLRYIIQHCKADVVVLEQVYTEMLPYIAEHPNVNLWRPGIHGLLCPKCGSSSLTAQGRRVAKTGTYRQFKCKNCHSWTRSRQAEKDRRVDVIGDSLTGRT
jgi:uncharacterized protein YprB with RNaseH-like and TPR domain